MLRHVFPVLLLGLLLGAACSAPTPPAPPTIYSLSGRVTAAGTTAGINGATVFILNGPNRKAVATTDAAGNYSFSVFSPSADAVMVWAPFFYEQTKLVDLTTSNTISFELVGGGPAGFWDY